MERSARKLTGVDLSAPVNIKAKKNSCFGKLWNPTHPECSKCPAIFECGNSYRRKVKKRVAEIESRERFVDMIRPEAYDWDKLKKKINKGKKIKLSKLIPEIQEKTLMDLEWMVRLKLKGFCEVHGFKMTDKYIK